TVAGVRMEDHLRLTSCGAGEIKQARLVAAGSLPRKVWCGSGYAVVKVTPTGFRTANHHANAVKTPEFGTTLAVRNRGANLCARQAEGDFPFLKKQGCGYGDGSQADKRQRGNPPLRYARQHEEHPISRPDSGLSKENSRLTAQTCQLP